jgi:hypothetical protein
MSVSRVSFQQHLSDDAFGSRLASSEFFPSPFADVASLNMPENNRSVLNMAEYIFNQNGTYRQAMERVMSYFMTDVELGGDLGDDEKSKWHEYLREEIDVMLVMHKLLRDRMCYGNGFASIVIPFRRFLVCKCGIQIILREAYYNSHFGFEFKNMEFVAKCPKCGYHGVWNVNDRPETDESKIKVKLWNVHEIEIVHDPYTEEVQYVWRIPEDYKRMVREGKLFHLERVSMEVLKAIRNNWLFVFHPDQLYHMKEPTVGGIRTRGWGVSRTMINYRQIYYLQVLKRYNEALALDYVIPFRLITPMPRPGAGGPQLGDPLLMQDQSSFMGGVRRMLRRRRRDPAMWHTLPFPVQYQALGGDASQLVPADMFTNAQETLLNDTGVPVDFYQGSMSIQAAPTSIRLFEAHWHPLVHDCNFFLKWLMGRISEVLSWEKGLIKLQRPGYADDIQRQMAMLQLMAGQTISQTSALRGFGLNWGDEQKLISEEARTQQEESARMQEEMEQSSFADGIAKGMPPGGMGMPPGGMAPGGAPAGAPAGDPAAAGAAGAGGMGGGMGGGMATGLVPTPNTPITPEDMMAEADAVAQQLLGMPETVKDSELRALKQKNPMLHMAVKNRLEELRQDARTAGGAAMLQQQYGRA